MHIIESYKNWEKLNTLKDRIILVGSGGSGKDYAADILERAGYKSGVLHTTRDKREGEVEGVTYYYISHEEFKEGLDNDTWAQADQYGPEWYGLSKTKWLN